MTVASRGELEAPALSPSTLASYFAALSFAFWAQSSQQTVISLSPTLTLIPPSLDFPIAHRALLRSHENPLVSRKTRKSRHDSHEGMVESREMSDFQILHSLQQQLQFAAAMATQFSQAGCCSQTRGEKCR